MRSTILYIKHSKNVKTKAAKAKKPQKIGKSQKVNFFKYALNFDFKTFSGVF
jgi:hypothetical protein